MPSEETFTLVHQTYRLDRRAGRLVNIHNPADAIPLQELEPRLLALARTAPHEVQLECLSTAVALDHALGRPQGSSSRGLLELVNPDRQGAPESQRIVRRKDIDRSR